MNVVLEKIKSGNVAEIIKKVLQSYYFPFITAAVVIICYYLGWDLVGMYYITGTFLLSFFLLEDLTVVIGLTPFIGTLISKINSPSITIGIPNSYYSNIAVIVQIAILASLIVCGIVYRIILSIIHKKLKLTPMFFVLCALSVGLIINGAFYQGYTIKNLLYGSLLVVCLLGFYILIKGNVKASKENYLRVSYSFLALSVMLVIEMIVLYATVPDIFIDFNLDKTKIVFGWGVTNTMGMLLTTSLPFILYIAGKVKYGYLISIYSILVALLVIFTGSRQSMLATFIIYFTGAVLLIVKGDKHRRTNLIIAIVSLISIGVFVSIFHNEVFTFFKNLSSSLVDGEGEWTGNGRTYLLERAIEAFLSSPIFGTGFHVDLPESPEYIGVSFVPEMYHNTVAQMFGSCGLIGLISYLAHRVQTVMSYVKNPNMNRTTIGLALLGLIVMGLFDNHIFYVFPTMFYACFVALLENGEKKEVISLENNKI